MQDHPRRGPALTRRRALAGTAAAMAGLAGCIGGGGSGPTPTGETVSELPTPVRGDPDAAVTVAAFEDYACPHCATYVLTVLPKLVEEYAAPGKIRYEHHDFPIPVDKTESWRAASAARAVQDEAGLESFWEYSHALYENQDSLSLDRYEQLVGDLGVDADPGVVRTAAETNRYKPVLQTDRQRGQDRGVRATPTVFVNDTALEGPDWSALQQAVEEAL